MDRPLYDAGARRLDDLGIPEESVWVGCDPAEAIQGATCDWREVRPGVAFVAIDPHPEMIPAVRERGADVVLVDGSSGHCEGPAVRVPDLASWYADRWSAAWQHPARELRLVGITGTNGKTTTAHLVSGAFEAAGRLHARLGTRWHRIVDRELATHLTTPYPPQLHELLHTLRVNGGTDAVMEVSSHALSGGRVAGLSFEAVGLTSFSPDHLGYHRALDAYGAAKLELPGLLSADGIAVAAVDDNPLAQAFLARVPKSRRWTASRGADPRARLRLRSRTSGPTGQLLEMDTPAGPLRVHTQLLGTHNVDNLLVAAGLGLAMGISPEALSEGLGTVQPVPHRLQPVRTLDGVRFVDDSKATNTGAVVRALDCFDRVYLLAGGRFKEASVDPLLPHLGPVRHTLLFGQHAELLEQALSVAVPCTRVATLDEAVQLAWSLARQDEGSTVLLSPACSSHDQFADFEARGRAFQQAVASLRTASSPG